MRSLDSQVKDDLSSTSGVGKLLRSAREARGLTALQVAGKLRLDVKHIEALERDEFTTLAAPVFARGYLRSYARFLELSPDTFVRSYENQKGPMPKVLHGRSVLSGVGDDESDRSISWVIYLIILSSLALGIVWWQTQGTFRFAEDQPVANLESELPPLLLDELQQVSATPSSSAQALPNLAQATDTLPPPVANLQSGVAVSPAPSATLSAEQINASAQAANTLVQPQAPVQTALSPQLKTSSAIPSVVLNLTAESWVDITDAGGNRLVYKLLPAGTSKTLQDLKLPLKVVLGNAAGVVLEYNGQPFDHSGYSSNGVTRFELGSANISAAQNQTAIINPRN